MTDDKPVGALKLVASGATDIGRRRACNEDRVLVDEELGLYVVADGAGGHAAGDLAAERAVAAVAAQVRAADPALLDATGADSFGMPKAARLLAFAVQQANRDVRELASRTESERGVGTTVVAALFSPRSASLHVAHVGDSRCYRLRAGHLEQLTQDHSLITDVLEERPDIPDEVLARLPKHVVTRALGMADKVRVALRSYSVASGDRFLLCTDGLSGPIPPQRIARIVSTQPDPEECVQALIATANDAGGPDNITALIIACEQGPSTIARTEAYASEPEFYPDYASDPELLILGIEEIHIGKERESASDDLLNALGSLMDKHLK